MMLFGFKKKNSNNKFYFEQKGFTLLEMMVVIGIFAVLSTIGTFNFRKFNSSTRLENLAYDVALEIRNAQVVGISGASFIDDSDVSSLFSDDGGSSSEAVGLHFNYSSAEGRFTDTIVLFQDSILNDESSKGVFDEEDRIINEIKIMTADLIDGICSPATEDACNQTGAGLIEENVAISFLRPNPDPILKSYNAGSVSTIEESLAIRLHDGGSSMRYIIVEPTGQIKVSDSLIE